MPEKLETFVTRTPARSRSTVFTALHCVQRGLGDGKAICLSVCLCVRLSNA